MPRSYRFEHFKTQQLIETHREQLAKLHPIDATSVIRGPVDGWEQVIGEAKRSVRELMTALSHLRDASFRFLKLPKFALDLTLRRRTTG